MLNTWSISMALSKSSPPEQKSSKIHVDGCEQLIYSFNRWSTSQYIPVFWGFQRSIWWCYHHFTIMLPSFYHHFAPIKICFSSRARWGSLDPSLAASQPPSLPASLTPSLLPPSFLLSFLCLLPLPTSFAYFLCLLLSLPPHSLRLLDVISNRLDPNSCQREGQNQSLKKCKKECQIEC